MISDLTGSLGCRQFLDSLSWSVGARGCQYGFLRLWFFSCSTLGPKPSPGNRTEIKSFLGLASYYRRLYNNKGNKRI